MRACSPPVQGRRRVGMLIEPLEAEFGWSRALTSGAITVNFILYGLTAPFAAALMGRFGLRGVGERPARLPADHREPHRERGLAAGCPARRVPDGRGVAAVRGSGDG